MFDFLRIFRENRIKMSSEAPGRLDSNITRRYGYGARKPYGPKSSKFFVKVTSPTRISMGILPTCRLCNSSDLQASLRLCSTRHSRFSRPFDYFRTKFSSNLFDFERIVRIASNNLFEFIRTNIEIRVIRRRPAIHIVVV